MSVVSAPMPNKVFPSDRELNAPGNYGIRRVVTVLQSALTRANYARYGIDDLVRRGIDVTVLDVSAIIYPHIIQGRDEEASFPSIRHRIIENTRQLGEEIRTFADADLIDLRMSNGVLSWRNRPVLRAVSRTATPYILHLNDSVPAQVPPLTARVGNKLREFWSWDWRTSVIARVPPDILGIRSASFVVYGGMKSVVSRPLVTSATKPIFAHACDYELWRGALPRNGGGEEENIAVFIDQFLPHHRDWALVTSSQPVDADNYYAALARFFSRIEDELGLKVVIAAHPRASGEMYAEAFGGREVAFGQTPELLARCSLAFTFTSFALNYAVLNDKPVFIVSTRDFYECPIGQRSLKPIARALGCLFVDLDDPGGADLSNVFEIDRAAYDRYITNYIKTPQSPKRPYWDIVLDHIGHRST